MKINDVFNSYTRKEKSAIYKVIKKYKLSGTSPIIQKYEQKLSNFFNSSYAVALSSGTAAIHCALFVLEINDGDEVIVPPIAPIMTLIPLLQQKAIPVFVDCKNDQFSYDILALEKCITKKTKAIITVPMWGYPYEYSELIEICKKNKIYLIEDNAQAHGTIYQGKVIGNNGVISCYSTHNRKILSTGEEGFILTNNLDIYNRVKAFSKFGNMDFKTFGVNYKLSALQAALGIERIKKINWQIRVREKNARDVLSELNNKYIEEINYPKNSKPNYYSLVLRFKSVNDVLKIRKRMNNKGIPSDVIRYKLKPLYEYPLFEDWKNDCGNAEKLVNSITTIPVHPGIKNKDKQFIITVLNNIISEI